MEHIIDLLTDIRLWTIIAAIGTVLAAIIPLYIRRLERNKVNATVMKEQKQIELLTELVNMVRTPIENVKQTDIASQDRQDNLTKEDRDYLNRQLAIRDIYRILNDLRIEKDRDYNFRIEKTQIVLYVRSSVFSTVMGLAEKLSAVVSSHSHSLSIEKHSADSNLKMADTYQELIVNVLPKIDFSENPARAERYINTLDVTNRELKRTKCILRILLDHIDSGILLSDMKIILETEGLNVFPTGMDSIRRDLFFNHFILIAGPSSWNGSQATEPYRLVNTHKLAEVVIRTWIEEEVSKSSKMNEMTRFLENTIE